MKRYPPKKGISSSTRNPNASSAIIRSNPPVEMMNTNKNLQDKENRNDSFVTLNIGELDLLQICSYIRAPPYQAQLKVDHATVEELFPVSEFTFFERNVPLRSKTTLISTRRWLHPGCRSQACVCARVFICMCV